ncbi:BTAD domain-containing putative transcriptional regulator [Nonomuraea angiospora]|uniref:DNA-binding SARP family transcriptional activator/tetratricopeptide (TPR) repeat protein n=1 Tax=Nonomuraea angiospora TaxID=46172 RepID=A0ABR9LXN0_9ACTN|nr:DNA-binding SARP family transcriptional activator/tetratricopeptide (TPR) repeat protein [Nonomuraea angiospora]
MPVRPAGSGGEAGSASGSCLRLQILGPLRLWRGGVELDAGPRQQAYLLALLLAREGRVISTGELVDLMWDDDAPASAVNVIHKYVGALRRLLEPELPIRGSGSYLRRRGNGYLFVAETGMLDLAVFRELVQAAGEALTEQRREAALDSYVEALGLWQGSAGEGLTYGPAAMSIFAGLDGEFLGACVAAAELAVSLGRPERMLPPLQLAASMAPLHEPVQASLVSTLGAAGQQAQALSVFRTIRTRLAEELGIDPGPALREAHRQVLSETSAPAVRPADGQPAGQPPAPWQGGPASAKPPAMGLVGRTEELSVLRQAAESALAGGRALVAVEGEPGVGKTRLLEEIAAEAARRGALVVWGRCLEGDGTPSMWPWVQAVGAILDAMPAAAREKWVAGELGRLVNPGDEGVAAPAVPVGGGQFRLFERVVAAIGEVSAQRPVLLVIDDLQWADVASLHLGSHLAARLPRGTLAIGALRDRAPTPGTELSRMLAAASRLPGHHRINLGPLNVAEVAEIVHGETGRRPGPAAARSIYARTAGNPFFVRELSRLLAGVGELTHDAVARTGVPSTVRDVVRDRMAGLDDSARGLLQVAALIGRDVDLGLLARAAGLDVAACLERLEPLEALGLLGPAPEDPYLFRFAHDLVRESVAGTTPARRTPRLHLSVADALEHADPEGESVAERLAYHLWAAGPLADPARTAQAMVRAGRRAAAKSAFEAAEGHLRKAARVARAAGRAELELSALVQLTAVVGMRSMYGAAAVDALERAEQLARDLGREVEATDFLFSRWVMHAQAIELDRSGPLARRLFDQGKASSDPIVYAYGLEAWGLHQWDIGNIGEAVRLLNESNQIMLHDLARREDNPVRHDLQLLMAGMLAEITALHGEVEKARALLDTLEADAGDDPYAVTIWAAIVARTASLVGDPTWALRAVERGMAVDPDFSFVYLGTYQRLARCWALAVTGEDQAGAAVEAERIIAANLLDPPLSCVATWYGLLGEMHLAAGAPAAAAAALDKADYYLDTCGQRYPEGLLLLLRARLLQALGEPAAVVRAAAEKAWALSTEREAHLFARRAEEFVAELDEEPAGH